MSEVVEKIYHESGEIYGAGKVHAIMKMNGYKVSRKAVTAIMHANGWINVRDGAKKQYFQEIKIKRDLLQQQFNPKRPNEVWVSDVTYFKLGQKQFYICVILDLYSRKAIACRISLKNLLKEYLKTRETEVKGIMLTLFDQERVTELYGMEMREEGRAEGYSNAYFSMVRRNLISKDIAAEELGISVVELEKRLRNTLINSFSADKRKSVFR